MIALGGGVGTALRYGVAVGLAQRFPEGAPYGTFAVNVLGSFLLGALMEAMPERPGWAEARVVLGTGLLGGFTTYSSFNLETLRMLEQGTLGRAALYAGGTFLTCALAGFLGIVVARSIRGAA